MQGPRVGAEQREQAARRGPGHARGGVAEAVADGEQGLERRGAQGAQAEEGARRSAASGSGATSGSGIATAPAGSGANSLNAGNLTALRSALAASDPTAAMDGLLFDISGTVAGRKVTAQALKTIADTASVSLSAQAGVDLDTEAVNLVRYQQAFQASGRVMQVAQDTFNTLLGIR